METTTFSELLAHAAALGMRDVAADDAGALPVCEPLEKCRSKDLRREAHRLKLRVVRRGPEANDHKNGYIALLRAHWASAASRASAPASVEEPEPATQASSEPARDSDLAAPTVASSFEETACENPANVNCEDMERWIPCDVRQSQTTAVSEQMTDPDSDGSQSKGCLENEGVSASLNENFNCSSIPQRPPRIGTEAALLVQGIECAAIDESSQTPGNSEENLDETIKATQYWESRLLVSKRKIRELHSELGAYQHHEEAKLLEDELLYYVRERKRALRSLMLA